MAIKKEIRLRVWNKFDRKCAYCGCDLEYKKMQVDHVKPLYKNDNVETLEVWGVERGKDEESNYYPACARCNRWKSTYSVEMFRKQIQLQTERLLRDSNQYRMALDYNLIELTDKPVEFWFERWQKLNCTQLKNKCNHFTGESNERK